MSQRDDTAGTVPDWAAFFAPEEWAWFVAAIVEDLDRRDLGHTIDIEAGCVHVAISRDGLKQARDAASGAGPNVLGLSNLAQICRSRPRDAWPTAIAHHFDVAFDAKDGSTADELAADWERAKQVLKLRLYVTDNLPEVPVVTWPVASGLVALLAFDLPDTVISVRREDRAKWSASDDELFAIALANVKREGLLPKGAAELGASTTLRVLEGARSFFAASHALFLEDYITEPAPYGAVVAVPHRHVVVYYPIADLRVTRALNTMVVSTTNMYSEGPGSISTDLYWWRRGRDLVRLPCELADGGIRFVPPPEFVHLLNGLGPHTTS